MGVSLLVGQHLRHVSILTHRRGREEPRASSGGSGSGVGGEGNPPNGTPLLPLHSEGNTLSLSRERPPSLCQAGLVAKLARAAHCTLRARWTANRLTRLHSRPPSWSLRNGGKSRSFLSQSSRFFFCFFFNSICRAFALIHFTPHSSHRFLTFSVSHLS